MSLGTTTSPTASLCYHQSPVPSPYSRSLRPLLRRIVLHAFPPRAQPAPDLGFESVLGGVVVDVASYTVREILLRDKTARVVVRILVAPAVAELFHRLRMVGIAQVHRHGTGALFFDIAGSGADRPDHGVALRRRGGGVGRLRHVTLR